MPNDLPDQEAHQKTEARQGELNFRKSPRGMIRKERRMSAGRNPVSRASEALTVCST
jgi:hypothetical protein